MMMPNTTDLLAGRPVDTRPQYDPEPRAQRDPTARQAGRVMSQLARFAGRLLSVVF